jgi:hypothetical protein
MSIDHIMGNGLISGYGNHSGEAFSQDDSAAAESVILDHLVKRYSLRHSQAVAVLAAVLNKGGDVVQLANGLQNDNPEVVAQFEACVP